MTARTHRRLRLGDVFQLETERGSAYLQYTHETASDGSLVRVLPGLYAAPPNDLMPIIEAAELFYVFLPVRAALSEGLITYVGHYPLPERARAFPTFRQVELRTSEGPVKWSLWDGERTIWMGEDLPEEYVSLSIREVVMPDLLAQRLADGWTPADEVRARAIDTPRRPIGWPAVRHYLYFSERKSAHSAAQELMRLGFDCQLSESRDESGQWRLLVSESNGQNRVAVVQRIASEFDGTYDGYDRAVS